MLKQSVLAAVLIAVPVALFAALYVYVLPHKGSEPSLGDLSDLRAIAVDVQAIAAKGDLVAAQKRITDFETLWDKDEDGMRPLNESAWGNIDDAADTAIHSLRVDAPQQAEVASAVKDLIATIDNPYTSDDQKGARMVKGIAVTDDSGHPLACENMIKSLRAAIDGGQIPASSADAAQKFVALAVERCNADDDANANNFSAQGLSLASHG